MCGIAGFYSSQKRSDLPELVRRMTSSIHYRGPEGEGFYTSPSGHVCLGHRRLAFLDLNPTGDQPMQDTANQYSLIFNGEIYNYRDLREHLKARGVTFRSTGDCEVLLQMLIHHGIEALPKLRGMFSLAFWDENKQELLLARDRFGIKPLVYAEQGNDVAFASEIKALEAIDLAGQQIDPVGFYYYLLWGSIAPPITWRQGVHSLAPGHWRRYSPGKPTQSGIFADMRSMYCNSSPVSDRGRSARPAPPGSDDEKSFRASIGHAVEQSVKLHLEADVPVGVFLSGGIDSSTLVSAVKQVSSNPVQTYTISFEEGDFSEEHIAAEVAKKFGTQHHICKITASHFLNDWQTIFGHYDQPTLDAFNSYYVSKVVAETGLKGVLSGTGGDEFFGGYPSFRWLPKVQSRALGLRWLGPLLQSFQKPHRREKWKHLCRVAGQPMESYRAVRGLFMPHEVGMVAGPALLDRLAKTEAAVRDIESTWLQGVGEEQLHATVSRLESRQYLAAQLLRDIDVMSMAHSLEVRVPLIDNVLCETVWPRLGTMPHLMQNKRLLYETLKRPLPEAVYQRPKQGFTFPMERWVKNELSPMVMEGMQALVSAGWLNVAVPAMLMEAVKTNAAHWSRPWALAVFGQLMQMRNVR
jgi:asparagine synthase (glutamine-hydrolysing)